MEKRTSERLLASREVLIGYSTLGMVKGKTLDISLGGMCIDTGSVCIPVNAAVNVTFTLETVKQGPIDCEAHAIVVRSENSACCLMFDGMSEKTHQALRSLVGDWQVLPGSTDMNQLNAF